MREVTARIYFFCFSIALLVAGLFLIVNTPVDITKTHVQFLNPSDQLLKGTLYSPSERTSTAAILVHGVVVNKEYMATAAGFLADNGILALTFDMGGYGESYKRKDSQAANTKDLLAAVGFLREKNPLIRVGKINLIGHSMGATAAIEAALKNPAIYSVAAVGMSTRLSPYLPCRLLLSAGIYDQFHSPAEMRESLIASTGQSDAVEGRDYRRRGCYQRLFLSSTANHQTEMSDGQILKEIVRWARPPYSPKPEARMNILRRNRGNTLAAIGLFLLLSLSLCPLKQKRAATIVLILAMMIAYGLSIFQVCSPVVCSTMIFFLFFLLLVVNYWTEERHCQLMQFIGFVGIMLICLDLTNILNAPLEYFLHPQYLLRIPGYLLQTWLNYPQLALTTYRPYFFSQYTTNLTPSWLLIATLGVELAKPGVILGILTQATQKISQTLRQDIRIANKFVPSQAFILLGILFVLALILRQRASSGFLSMEAVSEAKELIFYKFLPALTFMIIFIRKSRCMKGRTSISPKTTP